MIGVVPEPADLVCCWWCIIRERLYVIVRVLVLGKVNPVKIGNKIYQKRHKRAF